jgi:hypothetical protein
MDDDMPSTMSAAAKRQMPALERSRDLCGGTEYLRNATTEYLPKAPGEESEHYANRLARSVFFNAYRRSIEGLTGLVFRKNIRLGDDVPAQIVAHWENIDNAGTHGDVFCRDLLAEDLAAGHTAILVEFPKTAGDQSADEELAGDLRPYWVPIEKGNIMSWRTAVESSRTVLVQLVLREKVTVPRGAFGTEDIEVYRVFMRGPVIDQTGETRNAVRWALIRENANKSVTVLDQGTYPTQDEIPVAEIISSGRRGMFESDPPLNDLGFLNIAHYQMWSDYNWSIHKTCVPFVFGAGIDNRDAQTGKQRPIAIGANTAILMPNADASMSYVSHSGEALGEVKQALDDLKSDMGALGLSMLAPQIRSAETAEAKRLDKATSDSALSVTARGLQDGIERALGFHARYLGLDDGGSVEVNRDFEGIVMDAPVMSAFAQLVQAGFPPRSVLEQLQAGGRINENADLDELELLWMVGAEARRQAEADAAQMETAFK